MNNPLGRKYLTSSGLIDLISIDQLTDLLFEKFKIDIEKAQLEASDAVLISDEAETDMDLNYIHHQVETSETFAGYNWSSLNDTVHIEIVEKQIKYVSFQDKDDIKNYLHEYLVSFATTHHCACDSIEHAVEESAISCLEYFSSPTVAVIFDNSLMALDLDNFFCKCTAYKQFPKIAIGYSKPKELKMAFFPCSTTNKP